MSELDPELASEIVDIERAGLPEWHTLSVPAARRLEDELFTPADPPSVAGVRNLGIDGPAGNVPIRVYRPAETPAPTLVFFHGGGWVLGTLDSAGGICRRLSRRTGAVVVSVDYRLAPEHPFPAPLADCLAAVRWVGAEGESIGGDGRVGVAGSSAGGGLAAAVALAAARDDGPLGPALDVDLGVQALLYPALAPRFDTDSYETHAEGPLLTRADMEYFWQQYCQPPSVANPYAAPLAAETFDGVTPAVLGVGGHDPLADDTRAYAERLRADGVAVAEHVFPSLAHGFCSFADRVETADDAFDTLAGSIREQFDA